MSEDHLSTETSVSAEITESGVKAAAKSRTVAAIDRLVGNLAEWGNVLLESGISRRRATIEGERKLIEAAAEYGVERMGHDDAFAKRAFENHFKRVAQEQVNKDAVVASAIEDLRQNNPTEKQASSGPEALSEEFMGRFESYAGGASTGQLRARWGRILAGEIRKPGTFSGKVLRATDELDAEVAMLFEGLMSYRAGNLLVKCLVPKLNVPDELKLVSAGLLAAPSSNGHYAAFNEGRDETGQAIWSAIFGKTLVGIARNFRAPPNSEILAVRDGTPVYGVYVLTDVGEALSSILPNNEDQVGAAYFANVAAVMPRGQVSLWTQSGPGLFSRVSTPY
ncbi:DUF2806 domain-containing protein [Neorhizobium galegae]|uniref:DUF2806 domain-containing protein n=1 Tax=Neorhizobium galegae TaxID=399 RepID=UPI0021040F65|nr:DUF2806 domain-containing protein [Neorhizobium galegae]MCQ1850385.1 DUF2806 domain-containing protein [Neorhizobium galegae]